METHFRSGFLTLIVIIVLCVSSSFEVSAQTIRPKNVQVALKAKWTGTPLLLEAGYFILSILLLILHAFLLFFA